jgi:hypothetical protein
MTQQRGPVSGAIEITYRGVGGADYDKIEARYYFACELARDRVEEERGVELRALGLGMYASDPVAIQPSHEEARRRLQQIVAADQPRLLSAVHRAIYGPVTIEGQ